MITIATALVLLLSMAPSARAAVGGFDDDNPLSQQHQISAWENFIQDVEDFFGFGKKITKWQDVAAWKLVGDRFALGYGGDDVGGRLVALYDLSYPQLTSPITLGEVGGEGMSGEALVSAWESAKTNEPRLPKDIRSAIDAMGDLPEKTLRAGVIPDGWWKGLPWLPEATARFNAGSGSGFSSGAAGEPSEFGLADLDLDRMNIGSDFISDLRQMLGVILYGDDDSDPAGASGPLAAASDTDILNSIRFVREGQGHYKILLELPGSWVDRGGPTRPRKLLDLQGTKNGIFDNAKIEGLVFGLGELASLIPSPVIDALVSTAISRVGRYFKMTQTEHVEMLRELLTETEESSHVDPVLSQLSDDDRGNIIDAFMWTRVTPEDFWQWLFSTPASSWDKQQDQAARCAAQSSQWLVANGYQLQDLNPRFVLATDPATDSRGQRQLDLVADICGTDANPPEISIDYADPRAIAEARIELEMQGVAVQFATNLIPTFGFAVMAAYNYLVQDPVDNAQYWEARLMQHLELRPESAGPGSTSAWSPELEILRGQRINPLEISGDQMGQLIAARRKMMGL